MPTKSTGKSARSKPDDAAQVADFMEQLQHPLKAEIEALRAVIKSAGPGIGERIKWAAPSYHVGGEDLLTFNPRMQDKVHLVLHHPHIEAVASPLLEGDYKSRRMAFFKDMAAVKEQAGELQRVIRELLRHIGNK